MFCLLVLYGTGQWKLNSVSPLYNLQYDTIKFKQYALKIRQALVGSASSDIPIKFAVKIESSPQLRHSSEDPQALVVSFFILIN